MELFKTIQMNKLLRYGYLCSVAFIMTYALLIYTKTVTVTEHVIAYGFFLAGINLLVIYILFLKKERD